MPAPTLSPAAAGRPRRGDCARISTAPIACSSTASARSSLAPVYLNLGALDALCVEHLDRVGGARDKRLSIVVRLEVREHPVGERTRVSTLWPADADAEPQALLRR